MVFSVTQKALAKAAKAMKAMKGPKAMKAMKEPKAMKVGGGSPMKAMKTSFLKGKSMLDVSKKWGSAVDDSSDDGSCRHGSRNNYTTRFHVYVFVHTALCGVMSCVIYVCW